MGRPILQHVASQRVKRSFWTTPRCRRARGWGVAVGLGQRAGRTCSTLSQAAAGGVPQRLSECAGSYFWVYVLVRLLRGESCTLGQVGWLSTRWVRGERGRLKKMGEVEPVRRTRTAGENYFCEVTPGQLFHCS